SLSLPILMFTYVCDWSRTKNQSNMLSEGFIHFYFSDSIYGASAFLRPWDYIYMIVLHFEIYQFGIGMKTAQHIRSWQEINFCYIKVDFCYINYAYSLTYQLCIFTNISIIYFCYIKNKAIFVISKWISVISIMHIH
ncbi:hypothetical protein ACJX0J_006597, partial [Zea mays]